MVECTALEMRHTCKGIGGSNPSLSATLCALGVDFSAQISCDRSPPHCLPHHKKNLWRGALAMRHLPDPELHGRKFRRRKYWVLGAVPFGAFYGAILLALWQ